MLPRTLEQEQDAFVDAVRRGDVEWVRTHDPPGHHELLFARVSEAFAASSHPAGMLTALLCHGMYMRFGPNAANVLHACHGIHFPDHVLEEWTAHLTSPPCPRWQYRALPRCQGAISCAILRRNYDHARRVLPYVERLDYLEDSSTVVSDAIRSVCSQGDCEALSSRFLDGAASQMRGWPFDRPDELCCLHADASFRHIKSFADRNGTAIDTPVVLRMPIFRMVDESGKPVASVAERVAFLVHAFNAGVLDITLAAPVLFWYGRDVATGIRKALLHEIAERIAIHLPVEGVPEMVADYSIPLFLTDGAHQ